MIKQAWFFTQMKGNSMKLFLSVILMFFIIANLSGTALGEVTSNDQADATFVMTDFFVHDNSFVSSFGSIELSLIRCILPDLQIRDRMCKRDVCG